MKCNYITIEREYGSGGTEIARRVAQECGINCYGPEILEAVSEKYGIPVDRIQHYEETVRGSFLYTVFVMSQVRAGDDNMLPEEGHIFLAEQQAIVRLAGNGPAVFLGHCAAQALKKYPGVVKVFIRAGIDEKKKRITAEYGIPERDVESTRKRFDNKRSKYFYANTTKKWDDVKNYDMVLDSSGLGIDGCVAALRGVLGR